MANENHIYEQASPAADTDTDLYTVPASRNANMTVCWCNREATPTTVRVAIRTGGAALANQHYRVYDLAVPANDTHSTLALSLSTTDVITVRSGNGLVSFHCSGLEFSY